MSNDNKKIDNHSQLNLFEQILKFQKKNNKLFGTLNISNEVRQIVTNDIRVCILSRIEICKEMNQYLNRDHIHLDIEITVNMLNSWTAESHDQHRFPLEFAPAFCKAVNSYKLIQFLAEILGLFLLPGEEALRSEIQKLDESIKEFTKEKEKRLYFLSEIENNGKDR